MGAVITVGRIGSGRHPNSRPMSKSHQGSGAVGPACPKSNRLQELRVR
jgi:hypothetical protein